MFTIPPIQIKATSDTAWETTNTIHPYFIREDSGYFFVIYSDFEDPTRRNLPKEFKTFADATEWISEVHYPTSLSKFLVTPEESEGTEPETPVFILLDAERNPEDITWSYCPRNAVVVRKSQDFRRLVSAMIRTGQLPSVSIRELDTLDWMIQEIRDNLDKIPKEDLFCVEVIDHGASNDYKISARWGRFLNSL